MTKRTWCYTLVTTLVTVGLAACGGSGGGGGSGGNGIPTATNAAIAPPPTTAVSIATSGTGTTSDANKSIAANSMQASNGALTDASTASGLVGSVTGNSGTQAQRETLGEIVRRHAEKLRDPQDALNQGSVMSALQVQTQNCSGGGTATVAFDDANNSATEVFVNCNQGGQVTHGTLASSNVSVVQNLGPTVGSPYVEAVTASFTIDLSVTTASPAATVVTQGSFTFNVSINGNMQANGTGGVQPGPATTVAISMSGASLLTSDGTVRELLSNFAISIIDNINASSSTISGSYTFASTTINGSVMVNLNGALTFQPQGATHPSSGQVTITSTGSPGKIVLTVLSSTTGVRVDVYADANGAVTDTATFPWTTIDNL